MKLSRKSLATFSCLLVFCVFCLIQVATCPIRDTYLNNFDHGYQLGVGIQVLRGKIPGIDVLVHFGPLVFYSSALWYWLSGSLVGETIACAVAYAACLAVVYAVVARHASTLSGLLAATVAYWLEARHYKWYIWLFPLGTLWLLDRVSGCSPRQRYRWVAATGFWVGLGWLFRWDVGTTGVLACLAFFALTQVGNPLVRLRPPGRTWAVFLLGFAVPLVAWSGYLVLNRGWPGLISYVSVTIEMSLALSRSMAAPLQPFNLSDPLSPASLLVVAYVLVPATYLICGALWLWAECQGRLTRRSTLLLAIALIGGSTAHQALHRRGGPHLLQTIPPAILGASLIVAELRELCSRRDTVGPRSRVIGSLGPLYALLVVLVGLSLTPYGRTDLSRFHLWPKQRLRELAHPLDAAEGGPVLSALRLVREATDRDDPILVFPIDSQYYALVDRPVSGRMTVFVPGVFSSAVDAEENLRAIRQAMPRVVLLSPLITAPDSSPVGKLYSDIGKSHSYLVKFIKEHYTRRLFESDRVVVLAPAEHMSSR
ncbi:MAG: hypothetical protein ACLQU5_30880 [Isosphaeraceae bacterium]